MLCLRSLVMFLAGKLPVALQHVQHPLMYNLEHAVLLLRVKNVERQRFAEATWCRCTWRRSR